MHSSQNKQQHACGDRGVSGMPSARHSRPNPFFPRLFFVQCVVPLPADRAVRRAVLSCHRELHSAARAIQQCRENHHGAVHAQTRAVGAFSNGQTPLTRAAAAVFCESFIAHPCSSLFLAHSCSLFLSISGTAQTTRCFIIACARWPTPPPTLHQRRLAAKFVRRRRITRTKPHTSCRTLVSLKHA